MKIDNTNAWVKNCYFVKIKVTYHFSSLVKENCTFIRETFKIIVAFKKIIYRGDAVEEKLFVYGRTSIILIQFIKLV